jgi:hypothetical protein
MKSVISAATAAALMGISLSGCGTITQGTSQDIAIVSSPSGSRCDLNRHGEHLATLYSTPGQVHVDKTKYDIAVTCTKPGYQAASVNLESGYGIGTFGNIILGGAVGWGIDSATGADNKYPSAANVRLIPLQGDAAAQIAARSLCTPEDQELARLSEQNPYAAARMVCN